MSYAAQNLKYLRKQRRWTQEDMAEHLGIKRSLIGAYEEGRAEPRLQVMQSVCEMFQLTLEVFLFKDLSGSNNKGYFNQRQKEKLEDRIIPVHLVPIKAAAGYTAGYGDPDFVDELNTFTLPMLAPGNYRAFEIAGDSMLPTPSGSVIVGEKMENMESIKISDTYIVVSKNDGIVYKRIEKNNRNKKQLMLISDNPVFVPYAIFVQEVLELWRAHYIISKPPERPHFDVNHLATVVSTLQTHVHHLKKNVR